MSHSHSPQGFATADRVCGGRRVPCVGTTAMVHASPFVLEHERPSKRVRLIGTSGATTRPPRPTLTVAGRCGCSDMPAIERRRIGHIPLVASSSSD
jgi:hypothetical protein